MNTAEDYIRWGAREISCNWFRRQTKKLFASPVVRPEGMSDSEWNAIGEKSIRDLERSLKNRKPYFSFMLHQVTCSKCGGYFRRFFDEGVAQFRAFVEGLKKK